MESVFNLFFAFGIMGLGLKKILSHRYYTPATAAAHATAATATATATGNCGRAAASQVGREAHHHLHLPGRALRQRECSFVQVGQLSRFVQELPEVAYIVGVVEALAKGGWVELKLDPNLVLPQPR